MSLRQLKDEVHSVCVGVVFGWGRCFPPEGCRLESGQSSFEHGSPTHSCYLQDAVTHIRATFCLTWGKNLRQNAQRIVYVMYWRQVFFLLSPCTTKLIFPKKPAGSQQQEVSFHSRWKYSKILWSWVSPQKACCWSFINCESLFGCDSSFLFQPHWNLL